MKHRYIAVDGPIGVGKTSLVEALCSRLDAVKVLEDVDNPFLADFYDDKPGAAFLAQLFFLLARFRQQQELLQLNLFEEITIADYLFQKDKIFAYLNLDESELKVYDKLYKLLEPMIPKPDLVIYLSADEETLLSRIRKRNRNCERHIAESYIRELNESYKRFFHYYDATALLVIDTNTIDFVKRLDDLDDLIRQVERMDRGVCYYVPRGFG